MSIWTVVDGEPDCAHAAAEPVRLGPAEACEDCLREGSTWVHLRRCQECGHVGCCDNSPRRHATGHWQGSTHPVVASAEPGEGWGWCYADQSLLTPTRE